MKIEFVVPGVPKAKQRPRHTKTGRTYTPKETIAYEQWVKLCWMEQSGKRLEDGKPITAHVTLFFPIPASVSKKKREEMIGTPHIKKPDVDNCVKSILDGCQGCVFDNDSRIWRTTVEKRYGTEARAEVFLETI